MPLDHFIPQVHLKRFNSPTLDDQLYAIRKTDLRKFTPKSRAVCAIVDGSTNSYLREDRAIEDFLKTIEPKYNAAVDAFASGTIDAEFVYVLSGFVAYVGSCSPGGMRIQTGPIREILEVSAEALEEQGLLPTPPPALGGTTLTQLMREKAVLMEVDPKYPQAIGISSIIGMTQRFGNFKWEILLNEFSDSPFFTSDYPVALEKTDDLRILNKIVPLSPEVAVRIVPDLYFDQEKVELSFDNFGFKRRRVDRNEVRELNTLIVRCAEDMVFYRDELPWIENFVRKNRRYRIEPRTERLKTADGTFLIATQRVMANSAP